MQAQCMHSPGRFILAGLLLAALAGAALAGEGGNRFSRFEDSAPRVGDKAPMFAASDPDGLPSDMGAFLGKTHLVLVFGAYT